MPFQAHATPPITITKRKRSYLLLVLYHSGEVQCNNRNRSIFPQSSVRHEEYSPYLPHLMLNYEYRPCANKIHNITVPLYHLLFMLCRPPVATCPFESLLCDRKLRGRVGLSVSPWCGISSCPLSWPNVCGMHGPLTIQSKISNEFPKHNLRNVPNGPRNVPKLRIVTSWHNCVDVPNGMVNEG